MLRDNRIIVVRQEVLLYFENTIKGKMKQRFFRMKEVEKRVRKVIGNPETNQDLECFRECFRNKHQMWYCAFLI